MMNIFKNTILTIILIFIGCNTPSLPEPNNPYDPKNPNYEAPEAIILGGPVEGDTVNTSIVTFTWAGNEIADEFSYRLNDNQWSGWSIDTSATFSYLNEERYRFDLRARTTKVQQIVGDTTTCNFIIDAVDGPSLMFYPRFVETTINKTTKIQIIAEEVKNLMGTEINISYETSMINVDSIYIGDFLIQNTNIFEFTKIDTMNGMINIVLVRLGESERSSSGTGVLAELLISPFSNGQTMFNFIAPCIYRNESNEKIQIKEKTPLTIKIE